MGERELKIGLTTFEKMEDAERVTRQLVEEKLAVCAQIDSSIQSIYRWKGQVESAKEVRVWIKFKTDLSRQIEAKLQRLHPYDVPQWVVINVDEVSPSYLDWAFGEDHD